MVSNIPVIIIAHNQLSYIRNMVFQCLPLTKKIYIIDNASTYEPLLHWYQKLLRFKSVELISHSENGGHLVWRKYLNRFPDEYIITDPDLLFNPEMPSNAIEILSSIGKKFGARVVGLALDINGHHDFIDIKHKGHSIYDWEMQFWRNKIPGEEIYIAAIDTTFALQSKRRRGNSLRVAGKFTCKHIPWYQDAKSPLPISTEEKTAYIENNRSTNWYATRNLDIPFDIVKHNDTVIKIVSSDKGNWFNFMKISYNGWEQRTFDIIDILANNDKIFIDIGAWIGPISLYCADKFRCVYAIEADKDSINILKQNISLNNFYNIIAIDKAIYSDNKPLYFGPSEFYPIKEMNISVSQSREYRIYDSDYKVDGITFREIIDMYQISNIGIIKCDIEGGEENIIHDILTYSYTNNIPVWMSFHYIWWKKHKLEDFKDLFGIYYDDPENIINDIKNDPFKTILFYK